jgi:hypothetical protein
MGAIKILKPRAELSRCLMKPDHKAGGHLPMKPSNPFSTPGNSKENELSAPPSRFIDEKISDDSGFETVSDSALKPAELKNPFWN